MYVCVLASTIQAGIVCYIMHTVLATRECMQPTHLQLIVRLVNVSKPQRVVHQSTVTKHRAGWVGRRNQFRRLTRERFENLTSVLCSSKHGPHGLSNPTVKDFKPCDNKFATFDDNC